MKYISSSCGDDKSHPCSSPRLKIVVRLLYIMANCDLISRAGHNPGYPLSRYRKSEATHSGLRQCIGSRVISVAR